MALFLSILSSDGAWREGDSVIISTTITRVPRVVRYRGKGFARGQTLQLTLTPVSLYTQLLGWRSLCPGALRSTRGPPAAGEVRHGSDSAPEEQQAVT